MDAEGPWGWGNIQSKDSLIDIIRKLQDFETMTWGEIDNKKSCHLTFIEKIDKHAKERLGEIQIDAESQRVLYQLRLTGKERVWGIRELDAFYIVWWDPEHKVYPVNKKHT
ncbi:MAG: hypothetical protein GY757_44435 [bacterium]|nr:hypothetical protein [bacterium]